MAKKMISIMALSIPFLLLLSSSGFSKTIHVPGDQPTIQDGIDVAADGDTVLVAPGTYVENIDFKGKAINVTSSGGPGVTVIDGGQSGSAVLFISSEGSDSLLSGFKITNGTGTQSSNMFNGGGIYCLGSSPTIMDNHITANSVNDYGGGICCGGGTSAFISNNEISGNTADWYGGGIACWYDEEPVIKGNIIHSNAAEIGGGISCRGDNPLIFGNDIFQNSAEFWGGGISFFVYGGEIRKNRIYGNTATSGDGGLRCVAQYSCLVEDNTIRDNKVTDGSGGGITCGGNHVKLRSNRIHGNMASYGGGIQCCAPSLITNNVVYDNIASVKGGGIDCWNASPVLVNNVFFGNTGGKSGAMQLREASVAFVVNTVFWNNTSPDKKIRVGGYSVLLISYSDVEGGVGSIYIAPNASLDWGAGMIDSDPLFVNPAAGDFHIYHTSPCRDAGDNTPFGLPEFDFENDPRIAYGTVDMGADEFYTHLYWTGDATPGGNVALKFVGLPGTSPVQLWLGSGVMDPPQPTKYGDWYLQFPLLFQLGLGSIPVPDGVYILPFTFPPDTPTPLSLPFQAGIGTELSNLCVLEVE